MSTIADICRVLVWITLVVSTAFQTFAMVAIKNGGTEFSIVPMVIATVLMAVAVILFFVLPRYKMIPLLATVAAAVLFIIVAIWLSKEFTVRLGSDGNNWGLTGWRLAYRHLLPVPIPLLLFPLWLEYRSERKMRMIAAAELEPESYLDLIDKDFRIRVSDEEEKIPAKRSVRTRRRKEQQK